MSYNFAYIFLSKDLFDSDLVGFDKASLQRERFDGHDKNPYRVSHASRDREGARSSLTIPQ